MFKFGKIFRMVKTIAVVGISNNSSKAGYTVPLYLLNQGYDIVPVNPNIEGIFDRKAFPSLKELPADFKIDLVNVFRSPDKIPEVVSDLLSMRVLPTYLWLQLGISHPEAELTASQAGITVISNRCIKIEHGNWVEQENVL